MNNAKKGYPFGASLEATAGSTFVRGCARVSIAQKRYEYSFSSFAASLGGKIARSFHSAVSRCASADFTFSAFGAMAGVVREDDGVGGAGGDGGGALLSFGFGKKGSGGDSRGRNSNGRTGELPLFPLLIRGKGADVPLFRIKKPPTISPTTPQSTRAVRGGRGGYGVRYGVTQATRARALFWAWPSSARHRVWPRPRGSCR